MRIPVLLTKLPRANSPKRSLRQRIIPWFGSFFLVAFLSPEAFGQGALIRFAGETGGAEASSRAVAQEWAQKTGNKVEFISRPQDASAALQQAQQYWAAKSPDIDVYMVDVIWQGICAPHAVDLNKYFKDDVGQFFPRIIQNNTVGGKLVSIPWFGDAGILYYRTDLLEKYGYKEPPKTWEELTDNGEEDSGRRTRGWQTGFSRLRVSGKSERIRDL